MGFWSKMFTWWNGATVGTALFTRRFGDEVGRDDQGNIYYQTDKNSRRRWVIYSGNNDGSLVPPDWQLWLRGTIDGAAVQGPSAGPQIPDETDRQSHRHVRGVPPGRGARLRQVAARIDRRLRAVDPRISVTRLCAPLWIALTLAACGRGAEQANQAAAKKTASAVANQADVTPMAQRVAVLGILNKRNGIVQNVALHPGQSARWKDVIVRLRACETTAPWEAEKLTGAFVQVDVQGSDKRWRRAFSGWLYKESPSLNVVEHPVYDVWPKSCEMTYPAGPAGTGRAGHFEQPVERDEIRAEPPARARPHRPAAAPRRRRAPPTTTRHRLRATC